MKCVYIREGTSLPMWIIPREKKNRMKDTESVNTIIINYQSITSKQSLDALKHAHVGTSHNFAVASINKLEDEGQKTAEERVNTI